MPETVNDSWRGTLYPAPIGTNPPRPASEAVEGRLAAALGVWSRVCEDCDRQYVDWWADEDLWATVVGQYEGSLCFDCFRIRCDEKGIQTVVWNATAHYKLPSGREVAQDD